MEAPKRKGFNFYRSYFEVYLQLSDKDKIIFIDALLKKQFYGIEPTDLEGMASFAYLGQKHSIDSQVEGFENKTKCKLTPPSEGGNVGGRQGGTVGGSVQEKEKGKEKEQYVDDLFNEFWDLYHQISKLPKTDLQPAKKYWNKLTKSEQEKAKINIQNYVDTVNDPKYIVKCRTYLSNKRFNDEFESYKPKRLTDDEAKKMTPQEEMDYLRMVLKRDGNG